MADGVDEKVAVDSTEPVSVPAAGATVAAEADDEKKEEAEEDAPPPPKKGKKSKVEEEVVPINVDELPVDISGVGFILMGQLWKHKVEQLIADNNGSVGKSILKTKPQYVVCGPPMTTDYGGVSGEGSKIYKEAKKAKKPFLTEAEFMEWMERVQEAREAAEKEADAWEDTLQKAVVDETGMADVLSSIVVDYAVEEAPEVSKLKDWLKMEGEASDGRFEATLAGPVTDEELTAAESRLGMRLPVWLRQLLRLHNGVRFVDGAVLYPSAQELRPIFYSEEFRFHQRMRWLIFDQKKPFEPLFCLPTGQLVFFHKWFSYVLADSFVDLLEQFMTMWRTAIERGPPPAAPHFAVADGEAKQAVVPEASQDGKEAAPELSEAAKAMAAVRPNSRDLPGWQRRALLREQYPSIWRKMRRTHDQEDHFFNGVTNDDAYKGDFFLDARRARQFRIFLSHV